MSHYYLRHVSGFDTSILRRNNCTNTASVILALISRFSPTRTFYCCQSSMASIWVCLRWVSTAKPEGSVALCSESCHKTTIIRKAVMKRRTGWTYCVHVQGVQIDNHLNWKCHIDRILTKLSTAGFVIRHLFYVLNLESLRMAYFAYFYSVVRYGIIFWGKATNSYKAFKLQEKGNKNCVWSRDKSVL